MIPLEANIGKINPLKGSRVHGRLFGTLVKRDFLAESTAEANGTIIASKSAAAPCIGRLVDILILYTLAPGVDDKSFPDTTTDDIVNCINELVVVLVVEDKRLLDFTTCYCCIILLLN